MSNRPSDAPTDPRPNRRVGWVDDARGIGIFLVVIGHVLRGLHSADILDDSAAYQFTDAWIYAFHMPLFFLLSGLFAEKKTEKPPGAFLGEQASTIVYPYFLWSILQGGLQLAMSRSVNKALSVRDVIAIPVSPIMQYWFLYALLLIALTYYGLRRLGLGIPLVAAFFAGAWAVVNCVPGGRPGWFPLAAAASNGIYYSAGSVANRGGRALNTSFPTPVAIGVAAVGYLLVTAWVLAGAPYAVGSLATAFAGSAATIALAAVTAKTPASRILGAWGRASLAIFVAHTIASAAIRVVLIKVFKVDSPSVHIAMGIIFGLLFPLLLVHLTERWSFPYLFHWPRHRREPTAQAA